jgi:Spy/CpxP family protein refolding chaperone
MTRFNRLICASATLLLLSATPLLAQMNRPTSASPTGTTSTGRGRQQPCWQQAGISQQAQQQRKQIEQSTRSEVESVCQDSSLSQQQKQQKIKQIHQQTRQQMEGLMTPQQRQAMDTCHKQREGAQAGQGGRGMKGAGGGGKGQNPCGSMSASTPRAKPLNEGSGESPSDNQ